MFQEDSQEATEVEPSEEDGYHMYKHHQVDVKPIPYEEEKNKEIPVSEQSVEQDVEGLFFVIVFVSLLHYFFFPLLCVVFVSASFFLFSMLERKMWVIKNY